jgi:predicted AlkP superfamily phosphohydrolase/phosphomutase
MEMKLPDGQEEEVLEEIRRTRDECWEMVRQLYTEADYDLFWMVFTGTDRVQHLFWQFDDPEHPRYDPEKGARFAGTMRRYWIEQDRILGEFFSIVKPGTWVVVLSDHGFGPIRRELRAGNWLRSPQSGLTKEEAEDVFSLDRSDAARLYVRQAGRDPGGTRGAAETIALRDKLSERLAACVDPETGQKPIEAIYPAERIFVGKWAEKGPSLTALPSYGYYLAWGDADAGYQLPCCGSVSTSLSGWHRMDGIVAVQGPGVKPGRIEPVYNLLDLVPTCLHLLGRPLPEDLDGRLMEALFEDGFLKRNPPVHRGRVGEEDRLLTPEEEQQLKNLPYVGG